MNSVERKTIVGLLIVSVWLSGGSLAFAQPSGLFTQVDASPALSMPQAAFPDRAMRRSRVVTVDLNQLGSRDTSADRNTSLELNLFDDASFTAVLNRVDPVTRGFVWSGHIPAIPMSTVSLATEDGVVHGIVLTPESSYVVRFIGNGLYTIDEIDQGAFPPEAEPLPMDALAGTAPAPDALNEIDVPHGDSASFIDIMVLYTPSARTAAGGASAINALIANAISVTNTAYANSNIVQRLRLAHASEVSYTETGDLVSDLQNVTNGAGTLGGVASLRDTYRADLVTLMTSTPGSPYCGVAWLMTSASGSFQSLGFNVVEQMCAVGNLTLAHELGHNMGLRHDWYMDNGQTPYSYAHGHVNVGATPSTRWRTIMSYNDKCLNQSPSVSCTRLTYFSNPALSYLGSPMGVPAGTNSSCTVGDLGNPPCDADERLALNNTALTVANFRQSALSVTSLTANVTFPVQIGTPVTWTAVATSGTAPYSFKFFVYDGFTWTVGQDWSASNSWIWTPTISSTYRVQVWVRNAGSSAGYDAYGDAGPVTIVAPAPLTVTALTATPPGPVSINTMVTWTVAANGGTGPYTYKFWIFNGTTWSLGRDWSPSNTWTWTPLTGGTYNIQIWARNAGSGAPYDAWREASPYTVNGPPPLAVTSLIANQSFPLPAGTPVNWTAAASGGTGPYTYKFFIYNGTTWTVGQDWGASNSFVWTPPSQGTYYFQAWGRNAGSSAAYDAYRQVGPYSVTAPAPLTVTSLVADRVFPVPTGTPVKWTGLARGGAGPYSYKFFVYNGATWTVGQDWSPSSVWIWMPPAAGTYLFQMWVRNAGSTNPYDSYIAAGPITIGPSATLTVTSLTTSTAPVVGTPTTLTAVARGGLGPYTYKFLVYDGATWSVGQDWSIASTFNWIPTTSGSYLFQVWVRNAASAAALDASGSLGPIVAPPFGDLRLDTYVSGLALPVGFVQDPVTSSLQYVIEQGGTIRVIQNGVLLPTPFLDISLSISTGGERGLLGLAFAPSYATSGNFFVYFTNPQGNPVVARFKRSTGSALVADSASRFDLRWGGPGGQRFIPHPFGNHNGGHLAFGPDGYLYIASGDGGSGNDPQNHGQNPNSLLGKLLRIDVEVSDADQEGYVVPVDNPFTDNVPIAALPEIWAFGLRNPWKFSFDSPALGGTGAMFIGDVGQGNWEEIDHQPSGVGGRNYGWRIREGQHPTPGVPATTPAYLPLVEPIFEYSHAVGSSITGGFVYRGTAMESFYRSRYFYADLVGRLFSIATAPAGGGEVVAIAPFDHTTDVGGNSVMGLVSAFGQDASGEIYVVSYSRGVILKLVD